MKHESTNDLGILTLATRHDYLKAIGLALSVRVSNPDLPIAVACPPDVKPMLAPHFDHVIDEIAGLKGFVHKVHLDKYSPFKQTLFFDSDVLVFKSIRPYVGQWAAHSYTACGTYTNAGTSAFGLDREAVLKKLGKEQMVCIDGAGHAYFRKPDAIAVFEEAREVTNKYPEIAGDVRYADEDVMAIVMTRLGLPPVPYGDFFSRHLSGRRGTVEIDVARGLCRFVAANSGEIVEPCMMHFAADEAPLSYFQALHRVFRHFGVSTRGLFRASVEDLYMREFRVRVSRVARPFRAKLAAFGRKV